MTKKAFITGISGQDGSLLAELLLSKDYKVYGLLRENSSKKNLENIINNKNLQLVYGNSLNDELIHFLIETYKFDEVYNLASQSNIRLSYSDPIATFNTTLIGTIVLLENIKKYSPESKMFQAGSSAMYGNNMDNDGFQRETTPFIPVNPYASSKLFAYNISNNYKENNNLYISNGILYNHESLKIKTLPGIVNTVIKKAIDIKKNTIHEFYIPNLKIFIDIGHAKDYVEGIWLTLQQKTPDNYIISSGKVYSIEFICDYIFSKLDLDYKEHIKTEKNSIESFKLKGDMSKLKNLGWVPKYSLEDTIDEIINYYNK